MGVYLLIAWGGGGSYTEWVLVLRYTHPKAWAASAKEQGYTFHDHRLPSTMSLQDGAEDGAQGSEYRMSDDSI